MAIHSSILAWRMLWTEKSGYSPWDHKESDTAELLRHTHTHKIGSDTNSNVSDGGGFPFQQAILGTPAR